MKPTEAIFSKGMLGSLRHFRLETDKDGIVWMTFDKEGASTNTFSRDVMEELDRIVDELAKAKPRALVLRSGKSTGFIAGADIEEFTRVTEPKEAIAMVRRGWDTFEKFERLPFPRVALVRGFCMGGGLELALVCSHRIAVDEPGTRFALPEVMLGIAPFWGGMKRLTGVVGPTAGLDMMLTGRAIDARKAKKIGLADATVPVRVMDNAARIMALEAPKREDLPLQERLLDGRLRPVAARMARKTLESKARREHYPAPYAILDIWSKHDGDPFRPKAADPASILSLVSHPTTRNLIRIFGLQERMKAIGKGSDFQAKHVHVVGAGVMGGDIAAVCAMRGCTVTLQDVAPERIGPAVKRAADLYRKRVKDRLKARDAMDRLIPDVAGDGVRRADVIIEAIVENLEIKQKLFADLEARAKPGAILATNTSSLKLADIAKKMKNPARLIGLHFFNPVPQMQLVEIVAGERTDPAVAADGAAFTRQIDKLPLPVKDSPGFLVNRVLGPYMANAFMLVEEGIAPETLDRAAESFGMPMGPIELADVVGLDVCIHAGKSLAGPKAKAPKRLAQIVEAGKLGKKTGEGFYKWEKGKAQKGAAGRFDDALVERLIAPYLAEAKKTVAEGIVADADLADAGLIFGTGFAPFRGGPMNYLAEQGEA
ncbi:MAG: 3-hydroxyacyl-CoA dehydrogenase NAD-binding domain-containing protein [Burkholderiales bacterium]|nr:3-hydroxyacyl-CoA dehydrogenase NAD-binding domain-containing protein [Burkholderiales bacterium]